MDRSKKGGIDKLRGQVRFSSLQYLTIHPIARKTDDETLTVQLKNYVLLLARGHQSGRCQPDQAATDCQCRAAGADRILGGGPDYDGKVFRSVWQDYRGNTANDADALRW